VKVGEEEIDGLIVSDVAVGLVDAVACVQEDVVFSELMRVQMVLPVPESYQPLVPRKAMSMVIILHLIGYTLFASAISATVSCPWHRRMIIFLRMGFSRA